MVELKIAFVIYDRMTTLDFIGVFEPVSNLKTMGFLPNLKWDICTFRSKIVTDQVGLQIIPNKVGHSLADYDLVVIPGGPGSRELRNDTRFISWIKTAEYVKLKASVCTGALILGAAGFLKGRRATTHHNAFKLLEQYCSTVIKNSRIVDEWDVITSGGVTAALDLGIYLCQRYVGKSSSQKVRKQIEYLSKITPASIITRSNDLTPEKM